MPLGRHSKAAAKKADTRPRICGLPEAGGSGQTVAIVDAYNDPNANSDLKVYRKTYKLSECTEESGCLKKVNQVGETKNYPEANASWSQEISLDLDMVSAICSECHILLVEAKNNEDSNLYAGEEEAVTLGATEITNSWGSKEYEEEESKDSYFHHAGIPVTAAAGDSGYGVSYPAASQYVIAVGGTVLKKASSPRGWTEEVWSGTGSGCSTYEKPKPTWQHDASCSRRTDNDIAAVASASTPVSVYDTYSSSGWVNFGGTSVGSPIIAAVEAHAVKAVRSLGAEIFYEDSHAEYDVTSGSNGSCGSSYLCTGVSGYDGPTGMGVPNGVPPSRVAEETSPTSTLNTATGEQWVFYVNTEHEIAYWHNSESTKGWVNGVIGGSVKANTNPTAVVYSSGEAFVYYVNTSDEIANWTISEGKWVGRAFGGKVASSGFPGNVCRFP